MTFGEFLHSKVHAGTIIRFIWPERNKSGSGYPGDFKGEISMLRANVFDFLITQHDKNLTDYDVIVWLSTRDASRF